MRLVTTLGFDISHTLLILTKSGVKPNKIVVLAGSIRGEADQRAETAYAMLKQFANMVGIDIEKIDVDVVDVALAVEKIKKVLEENAPAILDLGGGLRLLVLETFIAYTLMDPLKADTITIYVTLEGRNEFINIDIEKIRKKVLLSQSLDETTKTVLEHLKQAETVTFKELLDKLNKQGYNISKQKLSKILAKLVKMGYIEKSERGKYKRKL
ncbi:MAG: helix-turn-helix domain-containing protein [Ignisphaera sp.]